MGDTFEDDSTMKRKRLNLETIALRELDRYLEQIEARGISLDDIRVWQGREERALAAWRECPSTEAAKESIARIELRCAMRELAIKMLSPAERNNDKG